MNETHDINDTEAADEGELDPREAARLLEQTKRDAQRAFDVSPPWRSLIQAGVVLLGFGAIWLSVRGQHPYKGPNGAALIAVYAGVIVAIAATTVVFKRATRGVSGRSLRLQRAEGVTILVAYVATAVFQGALRYNGASHAIVYGVFPAAGPFLVVGAALAGIGAAREEWSMFGGGLAVVALAVGSAFAGPAGVWAVMGIGMFVGVLGRAAVLVWLRRRA
jgi:hypothetical protein